MSKEKQVTLNSNSSDKDSFSEVVYLPANGSRATGEEKGVPARLPGSRSSKEGIHRWEQGELAGTRGLRVQLTCSSSCIEAASGSPSATRAIIVSSTIFPGYGDPAASVAVFSSPAVAGYTYRSLPQQPAAGVSASR